MRILLALTRYAETGEGDFKALDGSAGEEKEKGEEVALLFYRGQRFSSLRKKVVRDYVQDAEDIDCRSADRR
jgi:hypothetical protein